MYAQITHMTQASRNLKLTHSLILSISSLLGFISHSGTGTGTSHICTYLGLSRPQHTLRVWHRPHDPKYIQETGPSGSPHTGTKAIGLWSSSIRAHCSRVASQNSSLGSAFGPIMCPLLISQGSASAPIMCQLLISRGSASGPNNCVHSSS